MYDILMVVGGYGSSDANYDVEIIDLSGKNRTCRDDIADFPVNYGSVGTFIEGSPLVCGGRDSQSSCWNYDPLANVWNISKYAMIEGRYAAAAAQISETEWWITGG